MFDSISFYASWQWWAIKVIFWITVFRIGFIFIDIPIIYAIRLYRKLRG